MIFARLEDHILWMHVERACSFFIDSRIQNSNRNYHFHNVYEGKNRTVIHLNARYTRNAFNNKMFSIQYRVNIKLNFKKDLIKNISNSSLYFKKSVSVLIKFLKNTRLFVRYVRNFMKQLKSHIIVAHHWPELFIMEFIWTKLTNVQIVF